MKMIGWGALIRLDDYKKMMTWQTHDDTVIGLLELVQEEEEEELVRI